jgi:hypothetical protein
MTVALSTRGRVCPGNQAASLSTSGRVCQGAAAVVVLKLFGSIALATAVLSGDIIHPTMVTATLEQASTAIAAGIDEVSKVSATLETAPKPVQGSLGEC